MNPDDTKKKEQPKEGDDFQQGIQNGVNHDLNAVKDFVNGLSEKYKAAIGDNGNLKGLQDMADKKAQGYSPGGVVSPDGGEVDVNELPGTTAEPSFEDKLKAVISAMGMGAKNAVSTVLPGTQSLTNAVAPAAATATEVPGVADTINAALGTSVQGAPALPSPPQAAPTPVPQAPVAAPQAVKPAAAQPAAPAPASDGHSATDLLSKLTDGDGEKMRAVLQSIQAQNKMAPFAQALAVLGDTFRNVGMAKAGQRPEGFETAGKIQALQQTNQKNQIDNLTQQLASDPNSQTSRMAQATLMQSMGIKPGDPREAKIRAMPAVSITSLMPQMTDAVKNSIEREKNLIDSKKTDTMSKHEENVTNQAAKNAERQTNVAETNAANDTLKNTHFWNTDARNAALDTLKNNMGGGSSHGIPDLGSTFNGHRVTKVTKVR